MKDDKKQNQQSKQQDSSRSSHDTNRDQKASGPSRDTNRQQDRQQNASGSSRDTNRQQDRQQNASGSSRDTNRQQDRDQDRQQHASGKTPGSDVTHKQDQFNASNRDAEYKPSASKGTKGDDTRHQQSASGSKEGKNSINFDRCDYDTKQHLLRAQFKQGGNSITCCINEDVFTKLYECKPSENELKASFNQHKDKISAALLNKIANKQWKVPNKEIQLEAKDLR